MSNPRCACARCSIRGYMGPAIITTLGILFLLSELGRGGGLSFGRTYPILFIVIGAILLAGAFAPVDGHVSAGGAPPMPPPAPAPPSYNPPSGPQTGPQAGPGR